MKFRRCCHAELDLIGTGEAVGDLYLCHECVRDFAQAATNLCRSRGQTYQCSLMLRPKTDQWSVLEILANCRLHFPSLLHP